MVPFVTPSKSAPYDELAEKATYRALADAGIAFSQVQQAYVGYVYGDSTSGQNSLYRVGLTGIPIVNVNNNCSTGSTALWLARQAIDSGSADCVLVLGFEQMQRGALGPVWMDRPSPFKKFDDISLRLQGESDAPMAARYFGGAGAAYAEQYGTRPETFAAISVKARRHAANNPYAVFRDPVSLEEVMVSPHVYGPLTRLQCCPPSCGAAAAILTSEKFARQHGLRCDIVIKAQAMATECSGLEPLPHVLDNIGMSSEYAMVWGCERDPKCPYVMKKHPQGRQAGCSRPWGHLFSTAQYDSRP
jgi:acetyl-CoA acyltransferase